MSMLRDSVLVAVLATVFATVACDATDAPMGASLSLREQLAERRSVGLDIPASSARLDTRVNRGDRWDEATVELGLLSGAAAVQVTDDGTLVLQDLWFDVAPIPVTAMQSPVMLTGLRVHTQAPVPARRSAWDPGDERVVATGPLELVLDWSMATGDRIVPLGDATLRDIELMLDVRAQEDELRLDLVAVGGQVMWSWANLVVFSDLTAVMHGSDRVVPVD